MMGSVMGHTSSQSLGRDFEHKTDPNTEVADFRWNRSEAVRVIYL
jgi:hypothetical protein